MRVPERYRQFTIGEIRHQRTCDNRRASADESSTSVSVLNKRRRLKMD